MITTFACKETQKIWSGERSKKLPQDIQQRALTKLALIDAAETVDDLRNPPGNRLEALKGDMDGRHSVRINDQWRVCFTFASGRASDVEIRDYH